MKTTHLIRSAFLPHFLKKLKKHKQILIADDHAAIRNGIKHVLTLEFSSLEFDEAVSFKDIFKKLKESVWDLLILDIDLPDNNGLKILQKIKSEGIAIPVLIFSFHREDQFAIRALNAGAQGYLSKHAAANELITAVQLVLSGEKYMSAFVAKQIEAETAISPNPQSRNFLAKSQFSNENKE